MQYLYIVALIAGCGLFAPATSTDVPAANTPTIAQKLGIHEGLLKFCGSIDPAAAEKLREEIRQLVQGTSEQQLAALRGTDEYRKARGSVAAFAGKLEEHNAKRMCAARS